MAKFSISYIYQIRDKYSAPLAKIRKATDRVRLSAKKAGAAFANMGAKMAKVGAIATAAITTPILLVARALIRAASDAEETRSKFATIFRDISDKAEQVADDFALNFGLAGTAARKLLGDTSDMLTGFGFTQKAALDLSRRVNELAVDLASFTNFSGGAEGASAALTKALLGERESLKTLGIAILEEDVKKKVAILRAQGMRFETMRQAKAYATLQLAIEQSGNAIGDYSRTMNSFANVQRRVSGRMTDLKEAFGVILLPLATAALLKIEKLVIAFTNLDEGTKKTILIIAALVAVVAPLILALGLIALSLPVIATGFALLFNPITIVIAGVLALIAVFAKLMEMSGGFWNAMGAAAIGTIDLIIEGVQRLGAAIIDALLLPIKAFLNLVDKIPFVKINKGLTDTLFFSKMAHERAKIRDERLSESFVKGKFVGLSGQKALFTKDTGVAAQSKALSGTLNGKIDVTASGGAQVNSAAFNTSLPGNLGVNLAGAR